MESVGFGTKLKGVAKGLLIQGKGHVLWSVLDEQGMLHHLKLPAFYVPSARVGLMSMTSTIQIYTGEKIELMPSQARLSGKSNDPTNGAVVALTNPLSSIQV
jgi:hypothetical protein